MSTSYEDMCIDNQGEEDEFVNGVAFDSKDSNERRRSVACNSSEALPPVISLVILIKKRFQSDRLITAEIKSKEGDLLSLNKFTDRSEDIQSGARVRQSVRLKSSRRLS